MIRKIKKEVGCSFKENIQYMDQTLPVEKSFDIIRREMEIGGKESVFYYIDGFIKDEAMLKIMDSFLSITAEDFPQDAETFSKQKIPYVEVDVLKCFDDILRNVLSGTAVFFVEGYDAALCMDCRSYPARGVDEPDKDKSLRGSRDGFVETIVFNTALMRRRIRDPHLIMEMTVGAGVGTNAIVRSMTSETYYVGVDIDFVCAKNADVIGRFYRKNALGMCASLWHLPFANDTFDVVCSHFGLDECREISTILDEASRVLKTGGKLVLVSRHNAWLRRSTIFEKYDIDTDSGLHNIPNIHSDIDISDLYINGNYIDVRIFFEGDTPSIPCSLIDNNILPVAFLFIKVDSEFSNAEIIGFIRPEDIDQKNIYNNQILIEETNLTSFYVTN